MSRVIKALEKALLFIIDRVEIGADLKQIL